MDFTPKLEGIYSAAQTVFLMSLTACESMKLVIWSFMFCSRRFWYSCTDMFCASNRRSPKRLSIFSWNLSWTFCMAKRLIIAAVEIGSLLLSTVSWAQILALNNKGLSLERWRPLRLQSTAFASSLFCSCGRDDLLTDSSSPFRLSSSKLDSFIEDSEV